MIGYVYKRELAYSMRQDSQGRWNPKSRNISMVQGKDREADQLIATLRKRNIFFFFNAMKPAKYDMNELASVKHVSIWANIFSLVMNK